MFNFLFDGKIGDILAPVVPSNKLFLAIQHHKNDEVNQLILNNDVQRNAEGGHAAIHVACRYNNKYALDVLLSRGVTVDSVDQAGNTPLHYASKYGNIDICRFLIERGASPGRKNSRNETPYDVAGEHHVVRQYLLPLQFQAERSAGEGTQDTQQLGISTGAYYSNQQSYGQYGGGAASAAGGFQPASAAPMPPPQQAYALPPAAYYPAPAVGADPAGAHLNPSPPPAGAGPTFGAPPALPTTMYNNARPAAAAPSRLIQPDGFHSSASDPALQKKYGHIQLTNNIAPPPTSFGVPAGAPGPPGAYSAYGAPAGAAATGPPPGAVPAANPYANGGVYSRYVPYDAHTNSAAPIPSYAAPPAQSSFPSFLGVGRSNSPLPTHAPTAPQVSAPQAAAPPAARQLTALSPPVPVATTSTTASPPSSAVTPSTSAPGSQRLLGNRGVMGGADLLQGAAVSPIMGSSSGDGEVVITSSSSAVL